MEDKIKALRIFFRISNAAFECYNSIMCELSGYIAPTKMQQLHKMALSEIEKENPDLTIIDKLLAEMAKIVEINKNQK
jgi:hypothetical protein